MSPHTTLSTEPLLPEPWLTKRAVAQHYSLVIRTIERWIHSGCPSRQIGGVRRLRLSEVEAWLASQEQ